MAKHQAQHPRDSSPAGDHHTHHEEHHHHGDHHHYGDHFHEHHHHGVKPARERVDERVDERPLSYHRDGDDGVLPEQGSHSQGPHHVPIHKRPLG